LTERPAVTITAMLTLAAGGSAADGVSEARLIVCSVGSVPFAADTQILVAPLTGRVAADFEARAEQCAGQAAAGCAPLPDGEASVEYLRHLVFLHARQALRDAFARAS
jgi:CO/xanthine dehydrogenase FAD-binding subunit